MTISDPVIFVTCNKCGIEKGFNQTCLGDGITNWYEWLIDTLNSEGWILLPGGNDYCPRCVAIYKGFVARK
jgi:hypothetical protein